MPISPAPPSGRKISSSGLNSANRPGSPAAAMDLEQASHGDLRLNFLDDVGRALEDRREPAGRDDLHRRPELRLDAPDDAFDQADIAPEHAGMHAGDGVGADHAVRPAHDDAR